MERRVTQARAIVVVLRYQTTGITDVRRRRRVQRITVRARKIELAAFAADNGLQVSVARLTPVTSNRNKIEHRLSLRSL